MNIDVNSGYYKASPYSPIAKEASDATLYLEIDSSTPNLPQNGESFNASLPPENIIFFKD